MDATPRAEVVQSALAGESFEFPVTGQNDARNGSVAGADVTPKVGVSLMDDLGPIQLGLADMNSLRDSIQSIDRKNVQV